MMSKSENNFDQSSGQFGIALLGFYQHVVCTIDRHATQVVGSHSILPIRFAILGKTARYHSSADI